MSTQMYFGILFLILIFMIWYSSNRKFKQILCEFRRSDKTIGEKWVSRKAGHVEFEGFLYDIVTNCISLYEYRRDLHALFPITVQHLDFSEYKRTPHDPAQWHSSVITPEVRKTMNKSDTMSAIGRAEQSATGGKKLGRLQEYLPYIMLAAIGLIAFWVYNMSQTQHTLGMAVNAIEEQIKALR